MNKKSVALALGLTMFNYNIAVGINDNIKQTQSNLIENFGVTKLDKLNHKEIINTNISKIFSIYGKEKGLEIIREHLLIAINNFRKKNRSDVVRTDTCLTKSAQDYAEYINKNNHYGHTDQEGLNSWDRIENAGGNFLYTGENLAHGQETINKVFFDRINKSESHRQTILNNNYQWVGIGYDGTHRVLNFGGN